MTYRVWLVRASLGVLLVAAWCHHLAAAQEQRQDEFRQPPPEFVNRYHTDAAGRLIPRSGTHDAPPFDRVRHASARRTAAS